MNTTQSANDLISIIKDVAAKVFKTKSTQENVMFSCLATVITANSLDEVYVRLQNSPDDASQDFIARNMCGEALSPGDSVWLHYWGNYTNAYIAIKNNGETVALTAEDVGALPGTTTPADLGAAELNADGKLLTTQDNLIRVAKTASWTLGLTDADHKYFYCATNAITVTIPPNADVAFPIGVIIPFTCIATGSVTFVGGTGVSLYKVGGYYQLTEHPSAACLMKLDTDMWLVTGCDS